MSAVSDQAASQERRIRLWQDRVETSVRVQGAGSPLLYLHGPWGLRADVEFLALLAADHTVYAPQHPGTSPGEPDSIYAIDNWLDLVVYYGELLDRLGLEAPAVVGHSFGGMVAAELAATLRERVARLVLIAPLGLWRDDRPVKNWMFLSDEARRQALFADPQAEAAQRFFGFPSEPAARVDAQAGFIWSQACTAKFVWPIPDKGLKKHIHRIDAPTLIVWGREDGIMAPVYAEEFAAHIRGAEVALVDGAGHLPHLEQPTQVARALREFLQS